MGFSDWNVLGFVRDLLGLGEILPTDHRFACEVSAEVCKGSPRGVHCSCEGYSATSNKRYLRRACRLLFQNASSRILQQMYHSQRPQKGEPALD